MIDQTVGAKRTLMRTQHHRYQKALQDLLDAASAVLNRPMCEIVQVNGVEAITLFNTDPGFWDYILAYKGFARVVPKHESSVLPKLNRLPTNKLCGWQITLPPTYISQLEDKKSDQVEFDLTVRELSSPLAMYAVTNFTVSKDKVWCYTKPVITDAGYENATIFYCIDRI